MMRRLCSISWQAHDVAVKDVAVLADGDLEIEAGIGGVGLALADVVGDAAAPQVGAGDAVFDRHCSLVMTPTSLVRLMKMTFLVTRLS